MSQSKLSELINDETIPEEDSAPGDFVAAVRDLEGTPEDVAIDLGQELADKAPLSTEDDGVVKIYTSSTSGVMIYTEKSGDLGNIEANSSATFDVDFPSEVTEILSITSNVFRLDAETAVAGRVNTAWVKRDGVDIEDGVRIVLRNNGDGNNSQNFVNVVMHALFEDD